MHTMPRETWLWVSVRWACGAVILDSRGFVVDACPIYRWMLGKHWRHARRRLKREGLEWKPLTHTPPKPAPAVARR